MHQHIHFLQSFLAVAESGNITKAARELNVTQSALSRQIQILEDELGVSLFLRNRTGVELTEAGIQLQDHVFPLLKTLKQSMTDLKLRHQGLHGRISIGAVSEFGQSYLFPALLEFRNMHPQIEFEVQYLKEIEIIAGLRDGTLQWGLIFAPILSEDLRAFAWRSERSVMVTRSELSFTLETREDALAAHFVLYQRDDPMFARFFRQHFPNLSLARLSTPVAVNSHRSMIANLLASDSMALMPWHTVEAAIQEKSLRVASSKELSGKIHLIVAENALKIERHQALKAYLLKLGDGN